MFDSVDTRASSAKRIASTRISTPCSNRSSTPRSTTGERRRRVPIGRAQATLGRWWKLAVPPDDVLLLRATIEQSLHDFSAARADLTAFITDLITNQTIR
ncbi:MAG: hypothetical protein H0T46_11675 [Deltaproteobacteria bacterium]|nr:hypothetical protein [Deltaproteobacteria bacterium]